jgi:UDP-N-acetylmuramate: L-alanyl-gamma-D-glutamyl-meso-diaminopimelate ligase
VKRIHFIAIGGAAMHNLAIALKNKGYEISGSDDEIAEPSLSRLRENDLLPKLQGWHPENIHSSTDAVILGMHARSDNPELLKARELGLKIYSYPEFLYEQTRNKKRIVIAGSHGKTTTTAILIHVLTQAGINVDFMVGSQIEGFSNMVSLSEEAKIAVFEGDEYLSSPIDLRPKFIHYKPHIALISGIAWDHINVFNTFEVYLEQFELLTGMIETGGHLVYYSGDQNLRKIAANSPAHLIKHAYAEHPAGIKGTRTYLTVNNKEIPIQIFGKHNLQNINGAKVICDILGLPQSEFYKAMRKFPGTAKRLQVIKHNQAFTCYIDFAHAPSKVNATIQAVREQYPERKLIAVLELHTYSSLNIEFIPQYAGTLELADEAIVFYNKQVIEHKKMIPLSREFVKECFAKSTLTIIDEKEELENYLRRIQKNGIVLLLMSSGNFGGINISEMLEE